MTTPVMLAVLCGALLHASWNVLLKSGADKFIGTIMVTAGAGVVGLIALPFVPTPAPASWPYMFASLVLHVAYFALIAIGYRLGDLSLVYPIARGSAPLFTAMLATVFANEMLGPGAWLGVLLLSGGILTLAWQGRRAGGEQAQAVGIALANAAVIVAYTVVDGLGVRASQTVAGYITWLLWLNAIPLAVYAWVKLGDRFLAAAQREWRRGLAGGACTVASYAIALWAMTQAPIAIVAALRETSVIFGAVMAAALLHERFGAVRVAATVLVTIGAICLKMA